MSFNTTFGCATNFDKILTQNDRDHYSLICKLLTKMKINRLKTPQFAERAKKEGVSLSDLKLDYMLYFKRYSIRELEELRKLNYVQLWNKIPYDSNVRGSHNKFMNSQHLIVY
ncbi:Hypothetical protein ORPV_521 [Orpheovirus IHUMI-LCC2]|uniref:Uncharacterized protein n=1 Tax=Orpheovirus IHUMI-LCC2 TaxID=2023057 RepID=A0A2I2L4E5_9VIRU|nr:Hypothetical protein ORPV_521 [Orpheovirus IHUMI-LCC2]SNW62425.1 Hypothetical protein ORPV_521 [Orpheovirus IHUMI-LCC2]